MKKIPYPDPNYIVGVKFIKPQIRKKINSSYFFFMKRNA